GKRRVLRDCRGGTPAAPGFPGGLPEAIHVRRCAGAARRVDTGGVPAIPRPALEPPVLRSMADARCLLFPLHPARTGYPLGGGQPDGRLTHAMAPSLPLLEPHPSRAPAAPFLRLSALWIQITGTWCNLECAHCLNASGPKDPWLRPLDADIARRAIQEAETLGVKEIYFTG